jgi:hypothetical protein
MNNPFKILFKYPSRSRPERFFDGLDSIYNNLDDKDNFGVLVTLDEDDPTMNNDEVMARCLSYHNIEVIYGLSKSKVHAVNRDFDKHIYCKDFDILVCMSDDFRFTTYGFDTMMRVDMNALLPDFDGILHYPDQDAKSALATLYVAGRKWFEFRGRHIYQPSYKSLWCDNEEQDVAKMLNKYRYPGYNICLHLNPAYGHLPRDPLFNEQQGHWGEDEMNYNERKAKNFYL